MQVRSKSQLTTNVPRVGRVPTPAGKARLKPGEITSLVAENSDCCRVPSAPARTRAVPSRGPFGVDGSKVSAYERSLRRVEALSREAAPSLISGIPARQWLAASQRRGMRWSESCSPSRVPEEPPPSGSTSYRSKPFARHSKLTLQMSNDWSFGGRHVRRFPPAA